jgi:hypothetical protein
VPLVLGPDRIPVITSATDAARSPELAVLSALAHGNEPEGTTVVLSALQALSRLDDAHRPLDADFVLASLGEAARKVLEATMMQGRYEFQSWIAKRAITEGKAEAVLAVLAARGLTVGDEPRRRVLACTDLATLDRWLARAVVATAASEVLAGG